jgi:NADPH:quinone reductase-like Zn-dependent oxidoreductase
MAGSGAAHGQRDGLVHGSGHGEGEAGAAGIHHRCVGSVGRAAVQIALMRGATVSGNCSASGLEEAREPGLSAVFDYRTFDPARCPHQFGAVIDPVAALPVSQCNAMLKRGGSAVHVDFPLAKLAAIVTSPRHSLARGTPSPARMKGIADAAREGKLAPKIARTIPLTNAVQAITELQAKGTPKGKLVITPGS